MTTTSLFTADDHRTMSELFNGRCAWGGPRNAPYAGYRPEVKEAPAKDGKVDHSKRFLHIALKYDPPQWALTYLARAHFHACRVAEAMGVPDAYYPRVENGTLRVLEYQAGAGTVEHTDFNLFTILCWRNVPSDLELVPEPGNTSVYATRHEEAERLSPGLHIGDIGALVGLGPATRHRVPGRPYMQRSIVYFASPSMRAELPQPYTFPAEPLRGLDQVTVHTCGQWQLEAVKRSRVYG